VEKTREESIKKGKKEMSTNQLRIAGAVLLFAVIFINGYWLSRSGKPYNGIVFNIHKLAALTAMVFFVIILYRTNRVDALNTAELIAGGITVLFFLVLFVTGALLSIEKQMPLIILKLHQIVPYLAVLSTSVTIYFLLSRI